MAVVDVRRSAPPGPDAVTWLSCYVVLLFLLPSKLVFGPLASAGAPSMLMGLGSLVFWAVFRMGAYRPSVSEPQPIRVALSLFLFSVGVSFAIAMSHPINGDEVSPADVALLGAASWAGTLLVTHDGIRDRARLDVLVWRMTVCGGIIAALGIAQVLTGKEWVDRLSVPGLHVTSVAGLYTRGAFFRPPGTAAHPIEFGVVVTMLLPLALHVGFHHRYRGAVRWLPAAALAGVVPVTSSRSAYLGAIVGLAVCMIGWPQRRRLAVGGLGLAGAVAMSAVTPHLFNSIVRLFSGVSNDPSVESRTGSYDLAGLFIDRKPLFGRGLGTFLPKYRIFDNEYLGLLVSIGLVGTAAFVALGVVGVVVLTRVRRRAREDATRDLSIALTAAIVVGFASFFLFDAFAFPMSVGAVFLALGLAGALRRITRHDASADTPPW